MYVSIINNYTLSLTLGAHAQRGLVRGMCVCLCVCLSVSSNLLSRANTGPTRDTDGISMTCAIKLKGKFSTNALLIN